MIRDIKTTIISVLVEAEKPVNSAGVPANLNIKYKKNMKTGAMKDTVSRR